MICMFLLFVPDEILPLGQFLLLRFGGEDRLQRIGVVAGIEHLGGDGHGCWRKVLHLFKPVAHLASDGSQLGHVRLPASGMTGDEVRDELLAQVLVVIDAVKNALEVIELRERRLPHQHQHVVAGMFGCHLESSADMTGDEFPRIFHGSLVGVLVLALI